MSRYLVAGRSSEHAVEVGWLGDGPGGYWFAVFDVTSGEMTGQGGFDAPLASIADLVATTWAIVEWPAERATLVMLHDDPWVERLTADPGPPGVAELLAETFRPLSPS